MDVFIEDYNLIKTMKNDIDKELKSVKKNNIDYINKKFNVYNEKYKNIENQIDEINYKIKTTVNYLNKEGADIKFIHKDGLYSSNSNSEINIKGKEIKTILFRNKSNLDINKNIQMNKNYMDKTKQDDSINNKMIENIKGKKEEEKNKEKPKKSSKYQSDITKYIKGEIKANEIGSLTKFHHINEKKEEINDIKINLKLFQKRIKSSHLNKREIYNINDILNNSFDEKEKMLKTEKKIKRNKLSFKNLKNIELDDLNAQYHSDNISSNLDYKYLKTNNFNFKNILQNINFNSLQNLNSQGDYPNRNYLRKNLSFLSPAKFDDFNNYNHINFSGSTNNFFQYNNNNILKNMFFPLKRKYEIKINDNNLYLKNNLAIDSKVNQFQRTKLIKNISPLDLNINYNINNNNLNSLIGFGFISKQKLKQKAIDNNVKIIKEKTFYDNSLTIPAFKSIKNNKI